MSCQPTCMRCRAPLQDEKCAKCGQWNVVEFQDSEENSIVMMTTPLSEVKPSKTPRLKTGVWDKCYGGGVVKTSVSLVGGAPGAGKSTMLLQQCGELLNQVDKGLYLSIEEGQDDIKGRADRLKIPNQERLMVRERPIDAEEIPDIIAAEVPDFIILDSLPSLVGDDIVKARMVLGFLKLYAIQEKAPSIVVDHITKQDSFAGRIEIQHLVDVTLTLFPEGYDGRKRGKVISITNDMPRILTTEKSRHGQAFVQCKLQMTPHGLVLYKEKTREIG